MRKNRSLTRLASGALVVAVAAGGGLLSVGVAHAQAPPNLGRLTFDPPTGIDTTAIEARTSGGCTPPEANAYEVRVTGPNNFNFLIVGVTQAGLSRTEPFTAFFGQIMKDAAALQNPSVPLVAGTYNATLNCRRGFPPATLATYTGELIFTSPTAYRTEAPVKAAETPPAAPPSVAGPPSGAAQGQPAPPSQAPPSQALTSQATPRVDPQPPSAAGQLASERNDEAGQSVPWLVVFGAVLVAGVVIAVAYRIRKRPS